MLESLYAKMLISLEMEELDRFFLDEEVGIEISELQRLNFTYLIIYHEVSQYLKTLTLDNPLRSILIDKLAMLANLASFREFTLNSIEMNDHIKGGAIPIDKSIFIDFTEHDLVDLSILDLKTLTEKAAYALGEFIDMKKTNMKKNKLDFDL